MKQRIKDALNRIVTAICIIVGFPLMLLGLLLIEFGYAVYACLKWLYDGSTELLKDHYKCMDIQDRFCDKCVGFVMKRLYPTDKKKKD